MQMQEQWTTPYTVCMQTYWTDLFFLLLTGDWLCDDGGMVVRVVTRVEEVVVQRPVEPVVEELDGAGVQQGHDHGAVGPPRRQAPHARHGQVAHVEQQAVEKDLVVPAEKTMCSFVSNHVAIERTACWYSPSPLAVNLLELDAAVDDAVLAARRLVAGDGDPDLVVDDPQQQRRQDEREGEVDVAPSLGRHPVRAVGHYGSHDHVLHAQHATMP
jgi:hypothetical protein